MYYHSVTIDNVLSYRYHRVDDLGGVGGVVHACRQKPLEVGRSGQYRVTGACHHPLDQRAVGLWCDTRHVIADSRPCLET